MIHARRRQVGGVTLERLERITERAQRATHGCRTRRLQLRVVVADLGRERAGLRTQRPSDAQRRRDAKTTGDYSGEPHDQTPRAIDQSRDVWQQMRRPGQAGACRDGNIGRADPENRGRRRLGRRTGVFPKVDLPACQPPPWFCHPPVAPVQRSNATWTGVRSHVVAGPPLVDETDHDFVSPQRANICAVFGAQQTQPPRRRPVTRLVTAAVSAREPLGHM